MDTDIVLELAIRAPAPAPAPPGRTFAGFGFAGTGGGEGVRICEEGEVTNSSKSSNDMDVEDLELSACAEDDEPSDDSMDSRGWGNASRRGRDENAENESSSSSSSSWYAVGQVELVQPGFEVEVEDVATDVGGTTGRGVWGGETGGGGRRGGIERAEGAFGGGKS